MTSSLLIMSDFVTDWYERPEGETRYCATAHFVETTLTHSVYVLNCSSAQEALEKAEYYFNLITSNAVICKTIFQIEILPKNAGRWSDVQPELVKKY